ncbi:MAG TPA: hemerythrin domain-containing protein [Polyangiaceae bacterium]
MSLNGETTDVAKGQADLQIGKGPRQPRENLVDLLLECHQRIRSFSALAREVSEQSEYDSEKVAEACLSVARYFAQALPLHVSDEELSILPRLIGKHPKIDHALALMQAQHTNHRRPLERLVEICSELAQGSPRAIELGAELRPLSQDVERELSEHLRLEESLIFPAIIEHLTNAEQATVVRELRARRQLTP